MVPALAAAARERGATIVTGCAVRGIETKAGRVAGGRHRAGPIACQSVVLAGGAWSRLFCRNLGLTLPQLKVLASVMRVDGVDGWTGERSARRGLRLPQARRWRLHGGHGTGSIADIVPDSFRFFRFSCRSLRRSGGKLRFASAGASSRSGGSPPRWRLDEPSPFERSRILDPQPSERQLEKG